MTVGTVIWIIILILLLNTTAAIITVFKEKRDIAATWAWLLVLNLLPVVGFVIYLFAGKKISKEKIFDLRTQERTGISQLVALQKEQWNEKELMPSDLLTDEARQTVRALLVADDALCTCGSTNIDFRSFENNFESNVFIYDRTTALRMKEIFISDEQECVDFLSVYSERKRPFT